MDATLPTMGSAHFRWREEIVYTHDGKSLVFEAPMGVTPHPVYVPSEGSWAQKVPAWARDLRADVLAAIRAAGAGEIHEEDSAWVSTG